MAKDGNGFWRKASVLITIIIVTVTIIVGYVTMCNTVGTIRDDKIPKLENRCIKLEDADRIALQERRQTDHDVTELKSDVKYIMRGIDEIREELRER